MRVFVTGATGFIGKHLVNGLIKNGHDVHCSLLENEINPFGNQVRPFVINYGNLKMFINFLHNNRVDGIIHLASLFLTNHTSDDISNLIDSNVKLGSIVLECACQAQVRWFINTGSFWQNYQDADYSPVNLYAATKQAFEDIAKYYIESKKIKFATIRLSDTFGPNDTRPKIFSLWDEISYSGKVLEMSPGEQIIDISFIDDVVSAYLHVAKMFNNDKGLIDSKIFALKARQRFTLKELAKIFEEVTGRKLNIKWGSRKYRDREVMSPWSGGESIPEWEPNYTIKKGIERIYK